MVQSVDPREPSFIFKGVSRLKNLIPAILLLSFGPLAVGLTCESLDPGLGRNLHPGPGQISELILALAVGVAGLWLLPIRRLYRAILTVPYLALAPFLVGIIAVPITCGWYGVCR